MTADKPLSFYAANSLLVHIVTAALCLLISYFYYKQNLDLRKRNLKLVEASVRVDVVALPDKTLKELRSLEQLQRTVPAQKKPVVKRVETKAEPEKAKEGDFLKSKKKGSLNDLLKKYSKKKPTKVVINKRVKKKRRNADSGLSKKDLSALSNLVKKGNIVKSGAALAGSGSQEVLTALEEYSAGLPELVRVHWTLPSYLIESDLKCRIRIFLNKNGKVLRKVLFESSGDKEYDQRAMKSIDLVGHFPPVPAKIQESVAEGSIVLAFPL